jgi:hypothetical protein
LAKPLASLLIVHFLNGCNEMTASRKYKSVIVVVMWVKQRSAGTTVRVRWLSLFAAA